MKKIVIVSFALVLAVGIAAETQVGFLENAFSAIIQIELWDSYGDLQTGGNGFQLCDYDIGVTAYHVATDDAFIPVNKLQISRGNGVLQTVAVLYHDPYTDVALFDLPDNYSEKTCLDLGKVHVGQEVHYVTSLPALYMDQMGQRNLFWSPPWVSQPGIVTHCCTNYNALVNKISPRWARLAHSNLASVNGTSGSPILDNSGKVVGVLAGGFSITDTLFVPVEDLKNALDRYKTFTP